MATSVEQIRLKQRTYSKKSGLSKLLTKPSLQYWFEGRLLSRFFNTSDYTVLHAFPDGAAMQSGGAGKTAPLTEDGLVFDGSNDYTEGYGTEGVTSVQSKVADMFSESGWTAYFVFKNISTDDGHLFDFYDGGQGRLTCRVNSADHDGLAQILYSDASGQSQSFIVQIGTTLRLAVVYSTSQLRVVVNGVELTVRDLSAGSYPDVSEVRFGCKVVDEETTEESFASATMVLAAGFDEALSGADLDRLVGYGEKRYKGSDDVADVEFAAPSFLNELVITGASDPSPVVGDLLEVSVQLADYSGSDVVLTYQWKTGVLGDNIVGATSDTYELTGDEIGLEVFCTVTATNVAGADSTDTASVGPVLAA